MAEVAPVESQGSESLIDKLRAMPLAELRVLFADRPGEQASKQRVWNILHGKGKLRRHFTARVLARLVFRMGIQCGDLMFDTFVEQYPDELLAAREWAARVKQAASSCAA